MTLEELSWFVDDTVKRAVQGQAGIGRVGRYGGADTRSAHRARSRTSWNAYGITALSVSQQLRGTNIDLGSGRGQVRRQRTGDPRPWRRPRRRPTRRHHHRTDQRPLRQALRSRLHQGHLSGAEVLLALQQHARRDLRRVPLPRAPAKSPSPRPWPNTLDKVRAENPSVSIELIDDAVYYTYGNYEAAMHTLLEGALLAVLVGLPVPQELASDADFGCRPAAFGNPDLLDHEPDRLLAEPRQLPGADARDRYSLSTTPSSRSRTLLATSRWARRPTALRSMPPTKSASLSSRRPSPSLPFSCRSPSCPGIPGQYFIQFGLTVAFSVFFSLLVARLITPMMAAYFMRAEDAVDDHQDNDGRFMRGYSWLVRVTTREMVYPLSDIACGLCVLRSPRFSR